MNFATKSRVMARCKDSIIEACIEFNEVDHSKSQSATNDGTFEDLLSDLDLTAVEGMTDNEYSKDLDANQYESLKGFFLKTQHRFTRLETWRTRKSKTVVGVFVLSVIIGIAIKVYMVIRAHSDT